MNRQHLIEPPSLKEALRLRELRKEFTRKYDSGELAATITDDPRVRCQCCGVRARTVMIPIFKDGEEVGKKLQQLPLRYYLVEGEVWCAGCVAAYWLYGKNGDRLGNVGTPRSSTPRSQANYDGGRFHSGEW